MGSCKIDFTVWRKERYFFKKHNVLTSKLMKMSTFIKVVWLRRKKTKPWITKQTPQVYFHDSRPNFAVSIVNSVSLTTNVQFSGESAFTHTELWIILTLIFRDFSLFLPFFQWMFRNVSMLLAVEGDEALQSPNISYSFLSRIYNLGSVSSRHASD